MQAINDYTSSEIKEGMMHQTHAVDVYGPANGTVETLSLYLDDMTSPARRARQRSVSVWSKGVRIYQEQDSVGTHPE